MNMVLHVDEFYKEFYEQGHLNYAISCLAEQGSFDKYTEWLKTEPVAMFTNTEDWGMAGDDIVYKLGEEDEEKYPIGMVIETPTDKILHSPEGSQSMFYKVMPQNKLTALYVD